MITIRYLLVLLVLSSCDTKSKKSSPTLVKIGPRVDKNIETENRQYLVGDIDHDTHNDTAYVSYLWNVETNEIVCDTKDCDITIAFNAAIPKIRVAQSLGIAVSKTEDVNGDKANEILVFSRTNEGWWNNLTVWGYQNKSWKQLAETDAFIGNDKDAENRVVKENGNFYLIGEDKWNEDENGDFKKVKVRLF